MYRQYLSIRQVSQMTGIAVSTLYKLTAAGIIPHYKPSGKLLFKESEVNSWIQASAMAPQDLNCMGLIEASKPPEVLDG